MQSLPLLGKHEQKIERSYPLLAVDDRIFEFNGPDLMNVVQLGDVSVEQRPGDDSCLVLSR